MNFTYFKTSYFQINIKKLIKSIFLFLFFVLTNSQAQLLDEEVRLIMDSVHFQLISDEFDKEIIKPPSELENISHLSFYKISDASTLKFANYNGDKLNIGDTVFLSGFSFVNLSCFDYKAQGLCDSRFILGHHRGKARINIERRKIGFYSYSYKSLLTNIRNEKKWHWFNIVKINNETLILERKFNNGSVKRLTFKRIKNK